MADGTRIVKKKTKGKKFKSLAARMKFLYGAQAKTYSLSRNINHEDGMNFDRRKVTDKVCLSFFLIVVILMIFVSVWAILYGEINKVLSGNDAAGIQCGVGDAVDFPFVSFT